MQSIDKQIKEYSEKPQTPENLNKIGDLHLRRGEKGLAIAYFHNAVASLPVVQKEKRIAILKKIIMHAPDDPEAYEVLADILAMSGRYFEEKKWLSSLSELYRRRGEIGKMDETLQRMEDSGIRNSREESHEQVNKINEPGDEQSSSGSREIDFEKSSHPDDLKSFLRAQRSRDDWARDNADEGDNNKNKDEEEISLPEADLAETAPADQQQENPEEKVLARAESGIFSADIEEIDDEKDDREQTSNGKAQLIYRPWKIPDAIPRAHFEFKVNRRMIMFMAVVVIFSGIMFLVNKTWNVPFVSKNTDGDLSFRNIENFRVEDLQVSIARVPVESIPGTELAGSLTAENYADQVLFYLQLKPIRECIPDDIVSNYKERIYFLDDNGREFPIISRKGEKELKRVIYKGNICGKQFAPVHMKVFLHYASTLGYHGISIHGIDRKGPVILKWK